MPEIPAGAKQPQDRKKKLKKNQYEWRGRVYDIDENGLDDLDVIEALDNQQMTFVARQLLGVDQYQTLREHIVEETGRASGKVFGEFIKGLLEHLSAGN
ncbi:hypothetical protein H490_0103895 [Leucobacter sp. UCD-THU]|uniref:hypothetical protein n=1 Tax=Leucobacter sp. UCD-THU TaxID=1292023 RepID=UPI00035DBD36|nr:hypothetical protein [Leucobacter sp. UCD-THU]EYT56026.1 hypothetical protein H490_0103895 [Leucobacter sp. UCD-THU]